jgi:integrase/recombinase XerD
MSMLTMYRRHKKGCSHQACRRNMCLRAKKRADGQTTRCSCTCPIWADGFHENIEIRRSLKENTWEDAERALKGLKESYGQLPAAEPTTIKEATGQFLDDARGRALAAVTIYKYKAMFKQLEAFATNKGLRYVLQLDLERLSEFRTTWKDGPRASGKKLERVRAWLGFCLDRKWIDGNPAKSLKAPKVRELPTLPFTAADMVKTFATIDTKYAKRAGLRNAQRLKAFVLLLRYSGLRIGDAVSTSMKRIEGGKIFLYTAKTGTPVLCPLPQAVLDALDAAPHSSEEFYFWSGKSTLKSAVGKWQRRLHTLFELAEIEKGHAHRFRDTFAVELLLKGTPIERVSMLLGHRTTRITEKHYSPWVKARQEQLEADLLRTWETDPVLLQAGTQQVRGRKERPN